MSRMSDGTDEGEELVELGLRGLGRDAGDLEVDRRGSESEPKANQQMKDRDVR